MSAIRQRLAEAVAFGLDDTKNLGEWSQDYQDEMFECADHILTVFDVRLRTDTRQEKP